MSKQDDRKQVQVRIEEPLYISFKKVCLDRRMTVRDAIENFMKHFVKKNQGQ